MTGDASPYDSVIEDLEAEIAHLQGMLDGLIERRTRKSGSPPVARSNERQRGNDGAIQHDTFFGMTIADASRKLLAMTKVTKSTSEIAAALEQGGLKHSSKDFSTTIRATLGAKDEFLRVNGDWGLAEWYPGKRKEKKVKSKTEDAPPPKNEQPTSAQSAPAGRNPRKGAFDPNSIKSRILKLLASEPTRSFTGAEVAAGIDAAVASVRSALIDLFNGAHVQRPAAGRYQAKKGD